MSRHYKKIEDGYILGIGTGFGGEEITAEEHQQIRQIIRACPEPPQGYDYRLKTDLTWEQYALPDPEPETDGEISDSEALAIILGGETA